MKNIFENKTILITGGTGSIGNTIVRKLLEYNPKVVRIFDNNEAKLFRLEQEIGSRKTQYLVGDIRDYDRIETGLEDVDMVFHAAALKHVSLCEYNPFEAVKTNVIGTQNVIQGCLNTGVKKMVNISTDKTVSPIGVMGATKLLTERLIATADYNKGEKEIAFTSVRFGNVLDSNGSVVPVFKKQIKKGGPITVTSEDMTRFIISIRQAVNLVLRVARMMEGGEVYILKMKVIRIIDLAKDMIEELAPRYGYHPDKIKIKIIGLRPGEKLHESLMTKEEAGCAQEKEDIFVLKSPVLTPHFREKPALKIPIEISKYNSKYGGLLSKEKIRKILKETKII